MNIPLPCHYLAPQPLTVMSTEPNPLALQCCWNLAVIVITTKLLSFIIIWYVHHNDTILAQPAIWHITFIVSCGAFLCSVTLVQVTHSVMQFCVVVS